MTSEEYDRLTEEEQRIKVAECDGYKRRTREEMVSAGLANKPSDFPEDYVVLDLPHQNLFREIHQLPNYLYDLNAMHKATETMSWQQKQAYGEALGGGHTGSDSELNDCFTAAHATAAQRAKEFVLVMTQT
jgi:hypothetical protein